MSRAPDRRLGTDACSERHRVEPHVPDTKRERAGHAAGVARLVGLPSRYARVTMSPMRRERRDGRSARRSALAVTCTAAALAALAPGCGTPSTDHDASALDATIDVAPPPPRTLTFVLDQLTIDETDDPSVPHTGFNLDGLFSADIDPGGCTHVDYLSLYDNDQNCAMVAGERCAATPNGGCASTAAGCIGGVDNQLPILASTIQTVTSTDVRQVLRDEVRSNRLALIVRLRDVDSLANDPGVEVSIYRAWPTFRDGCTSVAADREYAIDRASLTGGTDIDANATLRIQGSIVAGRLRLRVENADAFVLPLTIPGEVGVQLALRHLQLRADVTSGGLLNGSLGGWVLGDDLIVVRSIWCYSDCQQLRRILGGLVDIEVDTICDGSALFPPRYGGISIGLGIHGVPATIATGPGAIVSGPGVGTCGYTPPPGSDR